MSKAQIIQSVVGYGLPYVFVEQVRLFRDRALLRLAIPEFLLQPRWFGKRATKDLIVRTIQSTHIDVTRHLTNGGSMENLKEDLRGHATEQILAIPRGIKLVDYKVREVSEAGDILCIVPLEASFTADSEHLTYILHTESGNHTGVTTVENVLEDGKVKTKASSYYLPSGELWSGPVHYHESKGWMAGPVHTSRAHPALTEVVHNNTRIHDYRIFNELRNLQGKLRLFTDSDESRVVSDLFLSRDKKGSARALFVLDVRRVLARKSRFNNLFFTTDVDNLMRQSWVQELKITRKRIEESLVRSSSYDIVAISGEKPGKGRLERGDYFVDEKYVGSVAERDLAGLGGMRAFEFYDSEIQNFEPGLYSYSLEATLVDPTIKFMQAQMKRLQKAYDVLNDYYATASDKMYYTSQGKIGYRGVSVLGRMYGSAEKVEKRNSFNFPWGAAVATYLDVLGKLTGSRATSYASRLYPVVGPSARSLDGVEQVLALLGALIQKIRAHGVQADRETSMAESTVRSSRGEGSGLVPMAHTFAEPYSTEPINGYGLDYFDIPERSSYTGLLAITPATLRKRFLTKATRLGVSRPSTQNMARYKAFYSKLNPLRVVTSNDEYDLSRGTDMDRSARLLRAKNQPEATGDTHQLLIAALGQNGSGATFRRQPLAGEKCQPEQDTLANLDSGIIMSGGRADNFTQKELAAPSEILPADTMTTSIETIVSVTTGTKEFDALAGEEVFVQYVTGFTEGVDYDYVEGPYDSSKPYLIKLDSHDAEKQQNLLGEYLIVGNLDIDPPDSKNSYGSFSTMEELDSGEEETLGDEVKVSDNSEAVPGLNYTIGMQGVISGY